MPALEPAFLLYCRSWERFYERGMRSARLSVTFAIPAVRRIQP